MPPETVIRSRQNPIYKQIRSLHRRDRRHQERAFLVEGPRFIRDAMASGAVPLLIAVAESFAPAGDTPLVGSQPPRVFDDELFDSLTDTVTSQGMLAVFSFPERVARPSQVPFVLLADGVQDPGNLGTLIRSAAGAGATEVIALTGTVDPWSPKVVRAAAAAHFLIPVQTAPANELATLIPPSCALVAADARGSACYDEVDLSGPIAVIVGGEGAGLSPATRTLAPVLLSIPLANGVESLNAGVAGSVLLFEAARQRRQQTISTKA